MATITTRQLVMGLSCELGVPISRDTIWNLCRRYDRLRKLLIRPQRTGALWHSDAIEQAAYLWRKLRPYGPFRRVRPVEVRPPRKARPTAEELASLRVKIGAILKRKTV